MPILDNIRHERFARYIAKGIPKSKAYILAGYPANNSNAITLWRRKGNTSQRIQRRVEQLMQKDSSKLTQQDILDHVYSTFELAYHSGQASAALKACEMLGKEKGLWRDRRENVNINISDLSPKETEQYLRDRYGDKAELFISIYQQYSVGSNFGNLDISPGMPLDQVGQPVKRPKLTLVPDTSQED